MPFTDCKNGSQLVQVRCTASQRGELRDLAGIFRADILDVSPNTLTVEMLGKEDKMKAFTDLLEPYGAPCDGTHTLAFIVLLIPAGWPLPCKLQKHSVGETEGVSRCRDGLLCSHACGCCGILRRHPGDCQDGPRGCGARLWRGQQVPRDGAEPACLLRSLGTGSLEVEGGGE